MLLFKKKKNCATPAAKPIGRGVSRTTNKTLLDLYHAKVSTFRKTNAFDLANDEILDIVQTLLAELQTNATPDWIMGQYDEAGFGVFSRRQQYCAKIANVHIIRKDYNEALHQFIDCIDDYGRSQHFIQPINSTELAVYICILYGFIAALKDGVVDLY